MLQGISTPELLIMLVIVIVLFGAGRISQVGKEMGTAIRDFRREVASTDESDALEV